MDQQQAALTVIETITAMAQDGVPMMLRVLPAADVRFWEHYPENDARDARTRSRWYYHVHAPGERDPGEHGHFHLFLHRTQLDEDSQRRLTSNPLRILDSKDPGTRAILDNATVHWAE